jgi:hypothetical protein
MLDMELKNICRPLRSLAFLNTIGKALDLYTIY